MKSNSSLSNLSLNRVKSHLKENALQNSKISLNLMRKRKSCVRTRMNAREHPSENLTWLLPREAWRTSSNCYQSYLPMVRGQRVREKGSLLLSSRERPRKRDNRFFSKSLNNQLNFWSVTWSTPSKKTMLSSPRSKAQPLKESKSSPPSITCWERGLFKCTSLRTKALKFSPIGSMRTQMGATRCLKLSSLSSTSLRGSRSTPDF